MSFETPDECGYNWVYKHTYCLNAYGVPGNVVEVMIKECKHKWGWHFERPPSMDYTRDNWYEDQTAYLSFEDPIDLATVVLTAEL